MTAKGTRSRTINAHGQLSLPILKSKAVAFAFSRKCGDRCRRTGTCALRDRCRAVRGFFRDARVPNRLRSGWRAAGAVRLTDDRYGTRCRSDRSRSEAPKADSEMARRVKRAAHKWQARYLACRAARERNIRADERRLVREQRRWRKVRAWWVLEPTRDVPGIGREPRSGCTAQPSAVDGAQRASQRGTWRGGGVVSFVEADSRRQPSTDLSAVYHRCCHQKVVLDHL